MDQLDALAAHEHGARAVAPPRPTRPRRRRRCRRCSRRGLAGAPVPDGGRAASMSGDSLVSVRPSAAAGGAFDRVASIPPKVASMPPPLPGIAPPPSMVGRGDLPPADAAASAMSSVEARLNAARVSGMAAGRRQLGRLADGAAAEPDGRRRRAGSVLGGAGGGDGEGGGSAGGGGSSARRDGGSAIASAEERARIFQQLQATVDAEELKRHEAEEKVRREQEAVEEAARLKREAEERAVREAEEKVRREQEAAAAAVAAAEAQAAAEAEGTANLQAALQTQDLATLQARTTTARHCARGARRPRPISRPSRRISRSCRRRTTLTSPR